MTLIIVTSPKGGVGVTTVAAQIALDLGRRGQDVLAVDLGDQLALGLHLGVNTPGEEGDDAVVAPSGIFFQHGNPRAGRGADRAQIALAARRDGRVIVADVAAGDNATRDALMKHAAILVHVLAADAGSLAVLPQAMDVGGRKPFCVLNLIDERRALATDAVSFVRTVFGANLIGAIRRDEAVNEALGRLTEIAPGSAARDFEALGARIETVIHASQGNGSDIVRNVA